jgi:hypothetical protein
LQFHTTKRPGALQALLAEKGVIVNGNDHSGVQIMEGELHEVEREAER